MCHQCRSPLWDQGAMLLGKGNDMMKAKHIRISSLGRPALERDEGPGELCRRFLTTSNHLSLEIVEQTKTRLAPTKTCVWSSFKDSHGAMSSQCHTASQWKLWRKKTASFLPKTKINRLWLPTLNQVKHGINPHDPTKIAASAAPKSYSQLQHFHSPPWKFGELPRPRLRVS